MEVHIMDSNKGFIKWLAGFLILGTIIGYLIVMSGQQKNDILISRDSFNEKVLEFDKDFYQTQADITINTESKERLLSNADKIDKELEKIKTEKEEKIKTKDSMVTIYRYFCRRNSTYFYVSQST